MTSFRISKKVIREAKHFGYDIAPRLESATTPYLTLKQSEQFATILGYICCVAEEVADVIAAPDCGYSENHDLPRGTVVYNFLGKPEQVDLGRRVFIDLAVKCGLYACTGSELDWVIIKYRRD